MLVLLVIWAILAGAALLMLAQREADRLEYRENYVKHLEDELARWKDSVE